MDIYKLGLVSDTWTSMVRNRVLRDMLTIDRLARKRGIHLVLAANVDLKPMFAGVIDVTLTEDLVGCETYRVYIDYEYHKEDTDIQDPMSVLERLPDDVDYEVVEMNKGKRLPGLVVEKDPYAGVNLESHDIQIIMETIDLDRKPPPCVAPEYL
jgi:hypothetical protein